MIHLYFIIISLVNNEIEEFHVYVGNQRPLNRVSLWLCFYHFRLSLLLIFSTTYVKVDANTNYLIIIDIIHYFMLWNFSDKRL